MGRKIAAACGELLRPVTLELSRKSAQLCYPDADLEGDVQGADPVVDAQHRPDLLHLDPILAPASRYDEVVEMVMATIAAGKQGDPLDADTVFGPCATESQCRTVLEYVESGVADGARVTTGGRAASLGGGLEGGYFVEPTVFADVTREMRISREEISARSCAS